MADKNGRSEFWLVPLLLLALLAGACTSTEEEDSEIELAVSADDPVNAEPDESSATPAKPEADEEKAAPQAAAPAGDAPQAAAPAGDAPQAEPPSAPVPLGPLEDEDMRHAVWSALEQRVTKSQNLNEGAEETTELGDYDSFKFAVIKVTSGKDDISGDTSQAPDGLEVEVAGWYKRTLTQSDQEPKSSCFSFDVTTPMTRRAGEWIVPDDYRLVFGREDQEDCY